MVIRPGDTNYSQIDWDEAFQLIGESSGSALNPTIGIGKGTVSLEDIHRAELIFVVGQNPGTNHPRMLSALAECKAKGGKIVAVSPCRRPGCSTFATPKLPPACWVRG